MILPDMTFLISLVGMLLNKACDSRGEKSGLPVERAELDTIAEVLAHEDTKGSLQGKVKR